MSCRQRLLAGVLSAIAVATSGLALDSRQAVSNTVVKVKVSSLRPWTQTGITLTKGEHFAISAKGFVTWQPGRRPVNPAGLTFATYTCAKAQYSGQPFLVPGVNCWSLVARIEPGDIPFFAGTSFSARSPSTGSLDLGFNDDAYADNAGKFIARITSS